jgi:transposase
MCIVQQVMEVWKRLARVERRWLISESMRSADASWMMRCKIVRNLARGERPERIAAILGCSRSQVYRVAGRFLSDGPTGLVDRREDNGQPKITEQYEWSVLIAVALTPGEYGFQRPTWTQELLVIVMSNETNISVSTSTMSRLLARYGARHGRPKPIVACPWSKHKKTRRLNEIRRLLEGLPPGDAMLYVDEVDIHLNPKIGDDWMLCGQQKEVLTPGKNEKRYLAGALNAVSGRVAWVEGPRKTSALFVTLVDHLLTRAYSHCKTIHLVLDNFRIHTSRAVQAAKMRWGERVKLHFLPPNCPDHNRIERLWKDLHDNVTRNHTCTNMDQLMQHVYDYLQQRRRTGLHHYVTAA